MYFKQINLIKRKKNFKPFVPDVSIDSSSYFEIFLYHLKIVLNYKEDNLITNCFRWLVNDFISMKSVIKN